jgi:DNA-binding response OmpR family regulator
LAKILVVDDEMPINKLVCKNLSLVGHECLSAYDGIQALDIIKNKRPDLVILDVMLPVVSGFEIIKLLNETPVIFVTAKNGLNDRLNGLSLGADDYIVKPFEMAELIARVQAVLRRTKRHDKTFTFDDITVDFNSRTVYKADEAVFLTPKEYDLLELLISNRNLALSREKILEKVWEYDYCGDTRTVDVHVQQLRHKLGIKERLKTVFKVGYRLEI